MRRSTSLLVACSLSALIMARGAYGEDLTVARYIDLTVARLQLAFDTWQKEKRSPTMDEENALWLQYQTTAQEYYLYRSAHPDEVDGYLAAHPELSA